MTRKTFLQISAAALVRGAVPSLLKAEDFRHHVEKFNGMVKEEVVNYIPDSDAWAWMKTNVPFFECPDRDVEEIYYFRWWTYRKHIKQTPAGFIVTEFLKPVKHAGEYNALSCAFGHHVAEGRWIHDARFLDEDIHFWLRGGENGGLRKNFHQFSGWAAWALRDRWLVDGKTEALVGYLDPLILDYQAWEQERLTESGLFWQRDVSDGMESSISGGRKVKNVRPSINSYMFGNATAIAGTAKMAGRESVAREYAEKARRLKELVLSKLWNADFFETRRETGEFAPVRENIGYTPWYFGLPGRGYESAWRQLMDAQGFRAPFGPTTAERRSPQFEIPYTGDDCQWNGPSWPFATSITLRGLANVLNGDSQDVIGRKDYFETLLTYTRSQHLKVDGRVIPWIDEDLNPLTGEWLARAMKIQKGTFYGRGDHYNHSTYCDLVITGLVGLRPREDGVVEVNPLVPEGAWDWFCLDRVLYHGRLIAVVWDRTGLRYKKGKGLRVYVDGREVARSVRLERVRGVLA
jgi:hypothetical protein